MSVDLTNATITIPSSDFQVVSGDGNQSISLSSFTGTADLLIRKDLLTTPTGIGLNADGIAYDDGTTITSTSWDIITDRIAYLSAIAPNGANSTVLAVNQTISIQNADSTPTRVINTEAGDTANVGEHFGTAWVGNTLPYVMETLDATNLQIKDTSLELYNSATPLLTTMTASGITTGAQTATWSAIITGGGGIPDINNVLLAGQNANNQPITNLNGIGIVGGTNLYNNSLAFNSSAGAITDLATINGSPYPPTSSQNLNTTLSYGNNTSGFNIDFNNNSDIQNCVNGAISYLQVTTINGNSYPPYPTAPYGLPNVLAIDSNAGGASMTGINNIDVSTINGSSYPPSAPDLSTVLNTGSSAYHDIDMTTNNIDNCGNLNVSTINGNPYIQPKRSYTFTPYGTGYTSNGSSTWGGTPINIISGTYSITYTIQFDNYMVYGSAGNPPPYMCRGYCFLHSTNYGDYQTTNTNNGYNPSFYVSNDSGFPNFITMTDMITIPTTDDWYLGSYFYNNAVGACGMWLFATLTEQ